MNQSTRMSKEQEGEVASRINAILQLPANQVCADCSVSGPQWASLLLKTASNTMGGSVATTTSSSGRSSPVLNGFGAVICEECAIHHMQQLGEDYTFLKYLCFHHEWTHTEELEILESTGNDKLNRIYEAKCFRHNITRKTEGQQAKFIRDKYKKCRYYKSDDTVVAEEEEEVEAKKQEPVEQNKPKTRKSAKENFMNFLQEKPDVVAATDEEVAKLSEPTKKPRRRKSAKENFMKFLQKTNSCPSLNISIATEDTVPLEEEDEEAGSQQQPVRSDSNGSVVSLCSSLDDSSHLSVGNEEEEENKEDVRNAADSTMDSSEARKMRRRRRRRSPPQGRGGEGGDKHWRELRRWGSDPALLSRATKSMARARSSECGAPIRPRRHLSQENSTHKRCPPKTPTEQGKVAALEELSDEFKMTHASHAA